ncbi:MAG: hypothetical protein GY842_08360 [bacterium]|nr:hypothetical protein [bacterium]
MSLAFGRIKVYVKLTLVVLVALAICAVLWKNRSNQVSIWFFWVVDEATPINVIWLMLCTALGTLIAYWTLSLVWGLRRDMLKMAQDSAVREREQEQQKLAEQLQQQEQRIDEKLKKAISDE